MRSVRTAMLVVLLFALLLPAAPAAAAPASPAGGIFFDDSLPDLILLGNGHYEFRFRKSNGSIAAIIDKREGGTVSLGSRRECLWGASFTGGAPDYAGGCDFTAGGPNRFTYAWLPDMATLLFSYQPDPAAARRVAVEVWVRPSQERWLDMRLTITNRWGLLLDRVLFPSDLVFAESAIKSAVLPILPGVSLNRAFWDEDRSYVVKYPGWPGVFADLASLTTEGGALAIYTLAQPAPERVRPAFLGFVHDDAYVADSTMYHHAYGVRLPDRGSWSSPWVRFLVGADWWDAALAYRDNLGLARFPSLREKLDKVFERLAGLPLYKADAVQLGLRFEDYAALFDRIPYPGLLHPVAYQPGGHDEHYPDFLPPDAAWGTTAEMAAMFRAARDRGFLVMPYTNPTWWDDESPTLQTMPPGVTLSDIAVIDEDGVPRWETYGPHDGWVVSPWPPLVEVRLLQLINSVKTGLSSNLVFEDQIGARAWLYDYNAAAPDHLAYMDGWLAHTRTYAGVGLMTELGYDRLAETEAGFHGSVLLAERTGGLPEWWHPGIWDPAPLAPLMLRDKVLFYQHDLAPETFTHDKATLGWNLAMGYQLSYDLYESEWGGGLEDPWLAAVGALQQHVLRLYAGEPLIGFSQVQAGEDGPEGTLTHFPSCSVLVNRDAARSMRWSAHVLAPSGSWIYCLPEPGETPHPPMQHRVQAGVFTSYSGQELTPGDHVLIEERQPGVTILRQPLGADTPVVVAYPKGSRGEKPSIAEAVGRDGTVLAAFPAEPTSRGLRFEVRGEVGGRPVAYYRVRAAATVFLPLAAAAHPALPCATAGARSCR